MTTRIKLESWLKKPRADVAYLALIHDRVGSEGVPFQVWRASEIGSNLEETAQRILQECDDYAANSNESVRVLITLWDAGKERIAQLPHTATPDEPMTEDEKNASQTSSERVIAMFMRHVENLQRVLTGSQSSIYNAFERTLQQNQQIIERQSQQIQSLNLQLEAARAARADDDESSEEARTESLARARAWEKLAELAPTVAEFAITHARNRANGSGAA